MPSCRGTDREDVCLDSIRGMDREGRNWIKSGSTSGPLPAKVVPRGVEPVRFS